MKSDSTEEKTFTVDEILAMDTSKLSLGEMIEMLRSGNGTFVDDVLKLRLRHEDDTGIPMEEDEIGEQEEEFAETTFSSIMRQL